MVHTTHISGHGRTLCNIPRKLDWNPFIAIYIVPVFERLELNSYIRGLMGDANSIPFNRELVILGNGRK